MHNWFVSNTFEQASQAAADFIAGKIETTIRQKNLCRVALPGGNTPAYCLELLAEKKLPWHLIHWYLGDERCYPQGHAERNDVMLEKNLWSRISSTNCYPVAAENGVEAAAESYQKIIDAIDVIDIAFLGMGEDGHTASLFPANKALQDTRSVVPVYDSPKAPDERVSLGLSTLKKATYRVVLTAGEAKAGIIARIKKGEALPVNSIGDINWFVDEKAFNASDKKPAL